MIILKVEKNAYGCADRALVWADNTGEDTIPALEK